jgi:predicted  nucleic acid-binding Zn-ribbon protein
VQANHSRSPGHKLAVVEPVRCLECGAVYSKPAGGGTVKANPGCPECGYLGWLSASIPFSEHALRRRSDGDRRRRHSA